jgi:hypothetical protein
MKKEIKISKALLLNILKALIASFLVILTLEIIFGEYSWYYPNYKDTGFSLRAYFTLTREHIYLHENFSHTILNKLPYWLEGILYDYKVFLFLFSLFILLLEVKRKLKFRLI